MSRAVNPDLKDEKRLDVGEAKKEASPAAQENPFEQSLTERKYARKISLLLRTQSTRGSKCKKYDGVHQKLQEASIS
ncbi:hypothetical protein CIHG_01440 [Coccidioides immitis H538.4]|uniref:Uncharacterized protein n=3 Tax=Coccidioides immitis TaxID=5501 RepID=A0A0J8QQ05_COCIT|nr:hypothetical protein CIRG_01292 [Coccidioides immitis RMSCC 2394]KMU74265.1 hypothetical protein CISG_04614 [Coccidioides immitis RMSCC 3703]KMU83657.1 hypothetical protein CIHG_01440 [Coccidioides immitis H538.4]